MNKSIPPLITYVLISWGLAVLVLAGLLSFWIHETGKKQDREREEAIAQQNREMCALTALFMGGPEPVPGPVGERARVVREAMTRYRAALRCGG